jgi:hypothetical protein
MAAINANNGEVLESLNPNIKRSFLGGQMQLVNKTLWLSGHADSINGGSKPHYLLAIDTSSGLALHPGIEVGSHRFETPLGS